MTGDEPEAATKGERRAVEHANVGKHPVHGRGLEDVMRSIANRGAIKGRIAA